METVALWVNRKPNKEFDLQMTGSQEVLFWYERTIISRQFFLNLIRRKYFRIQVSMNMRTGRHGHSLSQVRFPICQFYQSTFDVTRPCNFDKVLKTSVLSFLSICSV